MGMRGDNRNVFYAVGYCGHGVTLANMAGKSHHGYVFGR